MTEISLHEYCEQIENTIEQGRYAEAMAHGKHILKQYPKHVMTYQLLGKAMLEAGQSEYAADMFRRVLSADPEDMVAWVGMSEVHNQRDELDAAIWYLERAFELAANNEIVEEELRRLYGRREGAEPQQVQLTRGALARLYLKGDLLSRAISEFRALLSEHPERVDLIVALAEALWRNEQRLAASEVCRQVLDILPYCLKANLILGEIWINSGREEGEVYLRRAEALDPENQMAQGLFGATSPLLAREAQIAPLEYQPPTEEERPAWVAEVETVSAEEPPLTEKEAALVDITAALETQIEIPSWLEEVVSEEAPATVPPIPAAAEPLGEQLPEEAAPTPAEEVPEWLTGIGEEFAEQPAELGVEPTGVEEAPAVPGEEEAPGWLAELGVEAAGEEAAPSVPPAEQPPDWLAGIREQFAGEVGAPEEEEVEAPTPVAEEVPAPEWLKEEELPSGDEALAWLEQLAEGKEEELQAQAQADAEARLAEIMGRPAPTEAPTVEAPLEEPTLAMPTPAPAEIPDWLQEIAPPEAAPPEAAAPAVEAPPEEAVAPPVEEAFGWTAFGELEAPPEAVTAVEEAPPPIEEVAPPEAIEWTGPEEAEAPTPTAEEVPAPAWLEGEELPSGDEALAWLEQLAEGKEEELQAQAQADAEARLAEIMGRPAPTEAPTVEAPLEEPTLAMPTPAPAEIPDWLQEIAPPEAAPPEAAAPAVEAPPEEAAAPPVEQVPPVEEELAPAEMPEPAYPEEMEAPPVAKFPVLEEVLPLEEVQAPVIAPLTEEARWGAVLEIPPEEKEAIVPAPVVEEVPGVVEMEVPEPLEEITAPPEIPTVEAPASPFAAEQAYLKKHPRDYKARLALARALWQAGEQQEALEAYTRVIRFGKSLENVISDLEVYLEQRPDVSIQRVLGDAYMKDGRLQEALDVYRRALETL